MKLCATPDTFPEETKMNVFSDVTASDQAGSYNKTAAADGGKTAWIFAVQEAERAKVIHVCGAVASEEDLAKTCPNIYGPFFGSCCLSQVISSLSALVSPTDSNHG